MALKDWENAGKSKIAQRWDHKSKDSYVMIFARDKIDYSGSSPKATNKSRWDVEVVKGNSIQLTPSKTYKNKSTALRKAKEYMREH